VSTSALSFAWLRDAPRPAKRALLAASLGWMLDSFDVMLYSLVLSSLIRDFGLTKTEAGWLGSLTLLAAAAGGVIFGYIADRFGRTRALMGSILVYAIFTGACGLTHSLLELAVCRVLLGFGMGGEWASGAALVSETWPAEHRGKALGLVQSSWAIGYALAAAVVAVILPRFGWRAVFFVGVLPALLTLFLRRGVEESEAWRASRREVHAPAEDGLRSVFRRGRRTLTIVLALMNACTLFAWWGFNLWVPAYLSLPHRSGGVGLSTRAMAGVILMAQAGMWLGYVSFGFLSDRFGRKVCYVIYLLAASMALALYGHVASIGLLLALGPVLAFFATGYFSGFATVTAELYETRIRATAQGFLYNSGRVASALAPLTVSGLAQKHGFAAAFSVAAGAFVLAALLWIWIPETRGLSAGPVDARC
jgi:MFS family permease